MQSRHTLALVGSLALIFAIALTVFAAFRDRLVMDRIRAMSAKEFEEARGMNEEVHIAVNQLSIDAPPVSATQQARNSCIIFVPGLQCHKYDPEARARRVFGDICSRIHVICDATATRAVTAARCASGAAVGVSSKVAEVAVLAARELGAGRKVVLMGRSHGGRIVSRAVQALCMSPHIDLSHLHAQTYGSTYVPHASHVARADLTHVYAAGDVATRCRSDLYITSRSLIRNWRALRRPGEDHESATPTTFVLGDTGSDHIRWFIPTLDAASMDRLAWGHGPKLIPPHIEHVLHDHKAYTKLARKFAESFS